MLIKVFRTLIAQYLILALTACMYSPAMPPVIKPTLTGFTALEADTFSRGIHSGNNNGFGIKANSADYLLRLYTLSPSFSTIETRTSVNISHSNVAGFIELAYPSH